MNPKQGLEGFCLLYEFLFYYLILLISHTGSHSEVGSFCVSHVSRVLLTSYSQLFDPHGEALRQVKCHPIL